MAFKGVKIDGITPAIRNLHEFSKRIDKELRSESVGIARSVASAIRANIRDGPVKALRASIVSGPLRGRLGKPTGAYIRVHQPTAPDFHWWEWGTEPRVTETGARRGAIKATPSFRPVIDSINAGTFEPIKRGLKKSVKETKP